MMVPTLGKLVVHTDSGPGPCDVINDIIKFSLSNGYISPTDRPIDFVFDPRVGFSGTADRMDLLPVSPNPRWRLLMTSSRPDFTKIASSTTNMTRSPVRHQTCLSVGGWVCGSVYICFHYRKTRA